MQPSILRRDLQIPAQISPFQDSPSARAELVPFLMRQFQGEGACDADQWLHRLAYWWDENPFADAHPCRGWLLRDADVVVGFLGVIPTWYEDACGTPVPALIATSWAVAEAHRHAALPMGMMLQRAGRDCVMVDSTPIPEVQRLLQRWGWTAQTQVRHSLVWRGALGGIQADIGGHAPWPPREDRRIVSDPRLVTRIAQAPPSGRLQKHITPEYLRWYVKSPMREHHFLAVIDTGGTLSSYLIMTRRSLRGIPSWMVVDWFSTQPAHEELHALVFHLMDHSPGTEHCWSPFISLLSFPDDDAWKGLPVFFSREEAVCHHHWIPSRLTDSPVRHVIGEGDWGL
jgi:hypothetical protein